MSPLVSSCRWEHPLFAIHHPCRLLRNPSRNDRTSVAKQAPPISPTEITSILLQVTNHEHVTPIGRSLEPSMRSVGTHFEFCGCSLSEPSSPSSDPRAPKGAHCGSCGILMIILPFYVRCVLRRYHDFSPLCTLTLHIHLLLYPDHLPQHVR